MQLAAWRRLHGLSCSGEPSCSRYLHLDVFTDRRFEGNQLAVFPEPRRSDA